MSSPIERMIDDVVRCVKCGARIRHCECHAKTTAEQRREIGEGLASEVLSHLRSMYPEDYARLSKGARTSMRGTIINSVNTRLKALDQ